MASKKKTEKKDDAIRVEEKKIKLPCKLTEPEIVETGGALAAVVISVANHEREIAEAHDEFKALKKDIEGSITGFKVRISELSQKLTTGTEEREVQCKVTFNYEDGRVVVRRLDTDEVIEDREMDELEKQMQLDFDKENPPETSAVVTCNGCGGTGIDANNCRCEECRGAGEIEVNVNEPEASKNE